MIYAQWSDAKTIPDLCARSKVVLKVCDQKESHQLWTMKKFLSTQKILKNHDKSNMPGCVNKTTTKEKGRVGHFKMTMATTIQKLT